MIKHSSPMISRAAAVVWGRQYTVGHLGDLVASSVRLRSTTRKLSSLRSRGASITHLTSHRFGAALVWIHQA